MKTFITRSAIGVAALVTLAIAAALTYRALWQHRIASEISITSTNGIDEARYVEVNGSEEWVTIRGLDRRKPVILFLHGGPAEANSPFVTLYQPFERDYVFVQWDQPGAGMTYIRAGEHQPRLTLDSMANDGIAVAEFLRKELGQTRIILIGQDWGGVLGLRMISRRPDLFSAFVGTGQTVSMLAGQDVQYQYALAQATRKHDAQMLAALKQIGPPPYQTLGKYGDFQDCCRNPFWPADDVQGIKRIKAMLILSPRLSIHGIFGWLQALRKNEVELDSLLLSMGDLRNIHTKFSVPVFFIQGANDNVSPTSLVVDYAARIEAPAKRCDVIPDAGHFVMWTHPAEFLKDLDTDLRSAE